MTPDADADAKLRDLLHAYDQVLDQRPSVPHIALLRRKSREKNGRRYLLTIRVGLTFFIVNHMTRATNRLRSSTEARAASDQSPEAADTTIARLERFRSSLPNTSVRTWLASLVALAVLLALPATELMLKDSKAGTALSDLGSAVASANLLDFLKTLISPGGATAAVVLMVAFYLLLAMPLTAYRWKRILFAIHPDEVRSINGFGMSDYRHPEGGVYDKERDTFDAFGVRPVNEVRWDMVARAAGLASLVLLWLAVRKPTSTVEVFFTNLFIALIPFLIGVLVIGALWVRSTWSAHDALTPATATPTARATAYERAGDRVPVSDIASLWARVGAQAIDCVIVFVLAIFITALFWPDDDGLMIFLMLPVAGLIYSVPMLRRGRVHGRTLGKLVVHTRLVRWTGEPIGLGTVLLREVVFKWTLMLGVVSIYSLFVPLVAAVVWAIADKSNRSWHDLLAGTIAVRAAAASRQHVVTPASSMSR